MDARRAKYLRGFVGLSLMLGGIALLGGAISAQDGRAGGSEAFVLVVVSVAGMLLLIGFDGTRPLPWFAPAILPVVLLMAGILWARYDSRGHLFLSGLAPFVAILTGYGILKKRPWSWPVALVSVAGVGPILLYFLPFAAPVIMAAFVLFVVDGLFLLALAPSYFEPESPYA